MQPDRIERASEISEGVTALEFAKAALKARSYGLYFRERWGWKFEKWSNYEGSPFEDFYKFEEQSKAGNSLWNVLLCFENVGEDEKDFEYIALAARDTSTAYKWGRMAREKQTKFAFRYLYPPKIKNIAEWAGSLYRSTVIKCEYLEAATNNLKIWAESEVGMHVSCQNYDCWSNTTVPKRRLYEFVSAGLSIEDLQRRMTCKECGKRDPLLRPT